MRDLPMLYSAPMVRALIAGTKTQTRRLMPGQEYLRQAYAPIVYGTEIYNYAGEELISKAPISRGDRLYVREHWRTLQKWDDISPRHLADDRSKVTYEADPERRNPLWAFGRFRQAMHMPRWASRITLLVDDVKVERLQEIKESDALAEGVPDNESYAGSFDEAYCRRCGGSSVHAAFGAGYGVTEVDCSECETAKMRYRNLWNHINGEGTWDQNPWVVAYTFRVVLENIDFIGRSA